MQHSFSISFPTFLDHYYYVATTYGKNHDYVACFSSQGRDSVTSCTTIAHDGLENHFLGKGFQDGF